MTFRSTDFGDGARVFQFCARDYGSARDANLGCTRSYTLHIDNSAPQQPDGLAVVGGSERWYPDNGFDIAWSNPSQGASSAPIAAVRYRLFDSSESPIGAEQRVASPITSLDDLQVPSTPGAYTLKVWLEDAAGNVGSAARTTLRFDNQQPGLASPIPLSGWISRTELPYRQRVTHPAEPLPISGVEGYAFEVSPDPTADPCGVGDRCTSAQTDLKDGVEGDVFDLADLEEGTTYIHTAAVSGSGMESPEIGHTQLRIDRTDPVTSLSGVPAGWTDQNAALVAHATDALSGMVPSGADSPYTAIRVDGAAPTLSIGSDVSVAVTSEGVHTVSYYARDLAGNINDGGQNGGIQHRPPTTVQVRIDRTDPGIAFTNAQDPNDPELLKAVVSDGLSGAATGQIEFHRAGSSDAFTPLPTDLVGSTLEARWPSDDYPAGEYEFRAVATDAAGNAARSSTRSDGTQMVLPNPLKVPTAVRVKFGKPAGRISGPKSQTTSYGRPTRISGRLTAGLGSPLTGEFVTVTEHFNAGSIRKLRTTRVRTDARGLFAAKLLPGPSRGVSVTYDGTRTLTRAHSRNLKVRTPTKIVFSASSARADVGGRPVLFKGRVLHRGAMLPREGKALELQYRTASVGWTSFAPLETKDVKGDFEFSYSFKDDESRGIRFMFRVLTKRQSLWPYGPATSKPVVVTGR